VKNLLIVGAGPELGESLARRFGREGFRVGLVSRTQAKLDALVAELAADGVEAVGTAADVRDPASLVGAIDAIRARIGPIDVLEYSPLIDMNSLQLVTEMTLDRLQEHFDLHVTGAVAAVNAVLPHMLQRGHGGLYFTTGGTAHWPSATHGSGCLTIAALRHYMLMLSDAVAHKGVHVGSICIAVPGQRDYLADLYWQMYTKRDRVEVIAGDPEAMHAFEVLVLRDQARWFPIPRFLSVVEPTTDEERRTLLLALHQSKLMAPMIDDADYVPWLDGLIRSQGSDPEALRCGVPIRPKPETPLV
jgi:NAD(P)-dependent dehydrogenase (short-subunit alcohol dehydrogenase family)